MRERSTQQEAAPRQLASAHKDLSQFPVLLALAQREELIRSGKLTTIIFIRDRNSKGQEVLQSTVAFDEDVELDTDKSQDFDLVRLELLKRGPKLVDSHLLPHVSWAQISAYIDYAHRLKTEDFTPYFERKKRLLPSPSDLAYFNWETQNSTSNSTPNFQVITDNETGLLFKNKRDRKVALIHVSNHAVETKKGVVKIRKARTGQN